MSLYVICVISSYTYVCMRLYVLQISSWPTDLSSSETVVHSLYTLELKKLQWDGSNLSHFHGEGCDWANHPKFIHKVIGCQISTRRFTQDLSSLNSPLFPVAKAVQFFALKVIFKPWQPCCFRTEKQYIHSPSIDKTATTLSVKSEKLNPKIMPLLVVDLWKIDYGMKRFVLHMCCLDNHISCTASGSENGGLHKPNVLMHTTCRTQEGISSFVGKKLARIRQCSIKVLGVLIPWKGTKEKFTDIFSSTGSNFPTGLLIGLEGFNLALLADRV